MLNFSKGTPVAYPVLAITGESNVDRVLKFQTKGLNRFYIGLDDTAEGGGDAGSSFVIKAFTDAGAYIDTPVLIARASDAPITFTRTLDSTSVFDGAVVVAGGVGIHKSVHIGGHLTVGAAGNFEVDPLGNIYKIKGIDYVFPGIQGGADTYLKNDGNGNLSWAAASGSGALSGAASPLRVSGTNIYLGYANYPWTYDAAASVQWAPENSAKKALVLQATLAQAAPIFEIQSSNGTPILSVNALGTASFVSGVNASSAITVNTGVANTYVRMSHVGGYPYVLWNNPSGSGTTVYAFGGWPWDGGLGFTTNGSVATFYVQGSTSRVGINISGSLSAPLDQLSFGQAPAAGATRAMINLSNTALVDGNANGTYIGANPAAFSGDFIHFQIGGTTIFKVGPAGVVLPAHTHTGADITTAVENANHCPWTGLTGVPATFTPTTHTHDASGLVDGAVTYSKVYTDQMTISSGTITALNGGVGLTPGLYALTLIASDGTTSSIMFTIDSAPHSLGYSGNTETVTESMFSFGLYVYKRISWTAGTVDFMLRTREDHVTQVSIGTADATNATVKLRRIL